MIYQGKYLGKPSNKHAAQIVFDKAIYLPVGISAFCRVPVMRIHRRVSPDGSHDLDSCFDVEVFARLTR